MNQHSDKIDANSPAVLNYLETLQAIISRMASNSANCKTWCVTLTAAIIVLVARLAAPNHTWIGILPIFMFFVIDAYYLSLERDFIRIYNGVADDIRSDEFSQKGLFRFPVPRDQPLEQKRRRYISAMCSASVWPFYALTLLTLAFVRVAVLTTS